LNLKNTFILKPGNGKQTKILILDSNNQAIAKHIFMVKNLPPFYLNLGNASNGDKIDLDNLSLSLVYPDGISLQAKGTIKSWELKLENVKEPIIGSVKDLRKHKRILKKQKNDSSLIISYMYVTPDCILRKGESVFYR
jgi:hypothetical protein